MKKYILGFTTGAVILLSGGALVEASTVVRTGDQISINENQSVVGDFYAMGRSVTVSGEIGGDAYVAGEVITINGVIKEDIAAIGDTVSLHATATEDVRIIARDVTIAEAVEGDLVIVAGTAHILSTAHVSGNVLLFGGSVTIEGTVEGDVLGTIDSLRIDGAVNGLVDVTVSELVLGDRAVLGRDVTYVSSSELVRAPGAVVSGALSRSDAPLYEDASSTGTRAVVVAALISLFATLVMGLMVRRPLLALGDMVFTRPELSVGYGIGVLFVTPFVVGMLLVSVLGSFLGFLIFFVWLTLILVAIPCMNLMVGLYIAKYAKWQTGGNVPLLPVIAATALLYGLLLVPVVGGLLYLLVLTGTVGLIAKSIFDYLYR